MRTTYIYKTDLKTYKIIGIWQAGFYFCCVDGKTKVKTPMHKIKKEIDKIYEESYDFISEKVCDYKKNKK
jgi:hypothetical protein